MTDEDAEAVIRDAPARDRYAVAYHERIEERIAELLVSDGVVARCAGRMEFGARALGNRSILANPTDHRVVALINRMIKNRDFWMPFAPTILAERAAEYLVNPKGLDSPYMMLAMATQPGDARGAGSRHPSAGRDGASADPGGVLEPRVPRGDPRVRAPHGRGRRAQHLVQPARRAGGV